MADGKDLRSQIRQLGRYRLSCALTLPEGWIDAEAMILPCDFITR